MTDPSPVHFDEYAENYDTVLNEALSASGEDRQYFLRGRIEWLARCLAKLAERPKRVLDYGCGTGMATPVFVELLGAQHVTGVDVSPQSLEEAKKTFGSPQAEFSLFNQFRPAERIDLAYTNGVFHHIPPRERAAAVDTIYRSLRPGGLFAFWENNPWNPGTRYVMAQCPFDRDAITLSYREARRLLASGGFEILRTDFLFIFPRRLKWLRGLEKPLTRLPLGGQYQVLCRKTKMGEP